MPELYFVGHLKVGALDSSFEEESGKQDNTHECSLKLTKIIVCEEGTQQKSNFVENLGAVNATVRLSGVAEETNSCNSSDKKILSNYLLL